MPHGTVKATEQLEKAHVKDIIFSSSECATECLKLIAYFETITPELKGNIPKIRCFRYSYKRGFPYATKHLVIFGVSAILEHQAAATSSASAAVVGLVAGCVLNFIGAVMLSLQLNMVAIEQVHPLLPDLSASLNKLGILPQRLDIAEVMEAADELGSAMVALPIAGTWN
ncbi:hypothetical protein V6N11_047151 [Hibiscus sabdariffa]|uniref:Uncharacterized protein n=2 Tax=Hibiscus sabdariffa TaxID=183260 RepID=A0ABR2E3J4_9ROSI